LLAQVENAQAFPPYRTTDTRIQMGAGLIATLARVAIRTGLHVGLNDAAPDLEASLWLSWKWRVPNPEG
jgi:hypothetical protein